MNKKNENKTNKIIVIGVIVFIGVFSIFGMLKTNFFQFDGNQTIEERKDEYVDKEISKLMNSNKYKKSTDAEKVKMCEKLLKKLEKDKKIKRYSYSEDNMLFSYEYSSGILGGIQIKEFDSEMNSMIRDA